ncbi:MAG: hypothetical protein J6R26_00955 [Paludibacteraceae bacterium]|nr:hypothetical protein [Paludibacteraceae bacterium]
MHDSINLSVFIPNEELPIIIPFGPRWCGKTLMIYRLCEYLHTQGYHVNPVREFIQKWNQHYLRDCECYLESLYKHDPSQLYICDPILLQIIDSRGNQICYIFDADGDCYFNPHYPDAPYPTFINQILHSPNPKRFIYFVEPCWSDIMGRKEYVDRIAKLQKHSYSPKKDACFILYNKIDQTPFDVQKRDHIIAAIKDCRMNYEGLWHIFRQNNPFKRWLQPYKAKFIPFTSFAPVPEEIYTPSLDLYPERLWKVITNSIKNRKYRVHQ